MKILIFTEDDIEIIQYQSVGPPLTLREAVRCADRGVVICTRKNHIIHEARQVCAEEDKPFNVLIIQR
ncbi:hypothetical protein [Christensenella intestinihominis]|uniref:hypothetical protein n=1 Tax=Christensenella intestinihominis TaxID=1851429 RepID=UPI000836B9B9|nr:hypothetical protein [Christensenella intestinihominis]